jgi:type VI secretion system protein VasG
MDNHCAPLLRRLNPYCAEALAAAASLCQTRAHGEITVEHWLLKLLEQGEGDITVIARRYEWDMDDLWQGLLSQLEKLPRSIQSKPQLSNALQRLIKSAWLEASLQENIEQIRSVHLLFALISTPSLLQTKTPWLPPGLGDAQLSRLLPLLDMQSDERPQCPQPDISSMLSSSLPTDPPSISQTQQILDKFTLDLTAKARAGQIDPVLGRDAEIRQMIDILSRRRKNNPILVGEPGVGKTALVEGLALRIISGEVTDSLKSVSVRTLDLGLLQAGAGVKGEFEQRLKNIIESVQNAPSPVLLFIDEAHTLIGAGNQAGGADAANLLKPALARGELRTIAATTWGEYKHYFERDAALERRFQMVKVAEPDDDTACLMLRGLKERYAVHHGVHIQDDAIRAAVALSRRYLTGRQLPDKAVDLLDTAGARAHMSLNTRPDKLMELQNQITALDMERESLLQDSATGFTSGTDRLLDIDIRREKLHEKLNAVQERYQQEKKLTKQLLAARGDSNLDGHVDALQQKLALLQGNSPMISPDVNARMVASVVADWTGIPLGSLLKDEQVNLLGLENTLSQRIIGQHRAIESLAQRLRAAKTGLTPENCPLGVFLLVGSSGTGKTETALALADALFGGNRSLITINLSEYQEPHTVSQLKGSPPGYVGYGQGGVLTEAVRKRPYSVVLLDEVEKAHPDVLNLFYQVFDRGVMRDGEGREIDFRNTVIMMTANLGSDRLMAALEQQPDAPDSTLHELLRPILRDRFQPALLSRFQTLIYRSLDAAAMKRIVHIKLQQVIRRLHQHYGLRCEYTDSLPEALAAACLLPDSGARNIDSLLNQQILPVLSQQLLQRHAELRKPLGLKLGYSIEEGISLDFSHEERKPC